MRRSISLALALVGLSLVAAAMAPAAAAQDESMSMADHPFVGAWMLEPTEMEPPELFTASADGIVVNAGPDATGYGSWAPTGERSVDLTLMFPVLDPEAGHLGFVIIRASAEVSEDGQSFSGTWTVELPVAMLEAMELSAGEYGPGDVSGLRIAVEPMGEVVGPLPEFAEEPSAE